MDNDSTTTEALLSELGKHLEQLSTTSTTTPISSIRQVDLTSVDGVAMRAGPYSLVWVSTVVPAWAATVVGEYLLMLVQGAPKRYAGAHLALGEAAVVARELTDDSC